MQKIYFVFLITVITFLVSSLALSQSIIFEDNFDADTAGQQLACQNPVNWTTWSLTPCSPVEDAYVSNVNAYSGANSVVIVPNNDLVHLLGDVTTGKYKISFRVYIPAGKTGYFNIMSGFTGGVYEWALWVDFLAGGIGQFRPIPIVGNFTYSYDTWQHIDFVVDLDNNYAEFHFNDTLVGNGWSWTMMGAALKLAAVDFFGPAESEMYVDDFKFELLSPTDVLQEDSGLPLNFILRQNYPNPFNPLTTIEFSIPKVEFISLKVFDILGKEVSVLVNEERSIGNYKEVFDGIDLPSGVYYYNLRAGAFSSTRKFVLLK